MIPGDVLNASSSHESSADGRGATAQSCGFGSQRTATFILYSLEKGPATYTTTHKEALGKHSCGVLVALLVCAGASATINADFGT